MVKFHTFSDRTVRYNLRCDKKFKTEIKNKIDIKNKQIQYVTRDNVETINKLKRLTGSYNFVYQNYSELYDTYCKLVSNFNKLKTHEIELINENSSLKNENEVLKNTQTKPTENVNSLEHNETNVEPPNLENENEIV